MTRQRLVPFIAIHPGVILREELEARGIEHRYFAKSINVSYPYLKDFIDCKINLDENLAAKLEHGLNISQKTWLSLHNGYIKDSEAIAQINASNKL
jgi:HTH-type transcriptional regulator/antitoxin HigA